MKIKKLFGIAIGSVLSNKVRSLLTMLGIIIGISSVILLVGMGEGTKKQVSDQIEKLGTNLITISITGKKTVPITDNDLKELKSRPGIKEVAPSLSQQNVNIKAGTETSTTSVEGTTPNYTEIRNVNVANGRFIEDRDIENRFHVAVIGVDTANNVFNTTNVVGKEIFVNGYSYKIIGVLESQGSSMAGSNDDKILVPITTAQRDFKTNDIKTFYIEANSKDDVDTAMGYTQLLLNKKYNNDTKSYRVLNQSSLLDTANSTTEKMTAMLGGIAAISLLVGGIGIMNIMLVSVIERTREIGIRKAIGAKRSTILLQFLIEAATISTLGGILGVIVSYIGSYVALNFFNTSIIITNSVIIISCVFSVAVGVLFGIYPANKASKLNPIDALRFE
ncbi:putative ABC transport system permease protein [Clostridium cavendishii DSM 21758]|uniref:Putative ABC transport system permease protein n=1 Tax=Clostridium cavendishii DSM 21758 TaxID=1121302 RepID=A0A1M6F0B6_9CLOT|nr:ABC transporter permease [Clostridium cavendishii]SHI91168.1 putative ABC transport system permease protein [Clostridium cavendishii DSM 21758]